MPLYYVVFKEIKFPKNKNLANWQKKKSFYVRLKKILRTYNKKNFQGIYLKPIYKF